MKTINQYTATKMPINSKGYGAYLTQKQLQSYNKIRKEQESDKDSFVSAQSARSRRLKLRQEHF